MLKKRILQVIAILLFAFHGVTLAMSERPAKPPESKPIPAKTYLFELKQLQGVRNNLSRRLLRESAPAARARIIASARKHLQSAIVNKMIPHWYGTTWDYNGTTTVPGKGAIACGYFVTTVLKQSGLPINRVRLAQLPSETMIRRLMPVSSIKRFPRSSFSSFLKELASWGDGLYIVGLDNHTGFILRENNQSWFIHSSYEMPLKVIREKAEKSSILASSRYRVLGKLFVSDAEIVSWLSGR